LPRDIFLGGGNLLYRPSRSLTAYGRFPPIADIGARCDASAMTYQCCYCDQNIDRSNRGAIRINLSALWGANPSVQNVFAHSECAAKGFAANLSPAVPFDLEVFEPE